MTIDWETILKALGSAGSQTTVASLALLLFFYQRHQEKELRDEYNRSLRRLQAERRQLRKEIAELDEALEKLHDELDAERKARRDAEDEAHDARNGLRVVDGGKNG